MKVGYGCNVHKLLSIPVLCAHNSLRFSASNSAQWHMQITGDANVPAGRVSFCVSAEHTVPGPYNGFEREEVARGVFEDINRDIGAAYSFS